MTKSERTKQLIIGKAAELINKKGMAGTSMSDIMEATKLAKGGIYGNFENKDAICHEAYDFLSQKRYNELTEAVDEQKTARLKLFALLDYYNNRRHANAGGCHMLNFGMEADDTNPVMKKKVQQSMEKIEKKITKIIKEGIANKEFKGDVDAALFASKAFAMIEGAIFAGRLYNNNKHILIITEALKNEINSYLE